VMKVRVINKIGGVLGLERFGKKEKGVLGGELEREENGGKSRLIIQTSITSLRRS